MNAATGLLLRAGKTVLTLEMICQAQHRLRGLIQRTPLVPSATLSKHLGASVYLKLEFLQKTGSFKPRGAFNKMLSLSAEERQRGVVAVSGGNHAQGVAYAAQQLKVSAVIAMPASTPRNYLDATRGYGAEIILLPDIRTAFAEAQRLQERGRVMIHPFDDPLVAAGQGTIGLEILEDLPGVQRVYVSIGGGGLVSGVACALRAVKPEIRVIGVETHGADCMAQSLAANRLVELPAITSIARTLGAPMPCDFTLRHVQRLVHEVKVVSDAAAAKALFLLLERTKYLVEPAAACCLAAAQEQRDQWRPDDQVVLLLCGGNLSGEDLSSFWQRFMAPMENRSGRP
jgi:threonine dehydratase